MIINQETINSAISIVKFNIEIFKDDMEMLEIEKSRLSLLEKFSAGEIEYKDLPYQVAMYMYVPPKGFTYGT